MAEIFTYNGVMGKGFQRIRAEIKRNDANARNRNTPHDRTKTHRTGRCNCK